MYGVCSLPRLSEVIEGVAGKRAAYAGRVGLKERLKVAGEVGLHGLTRFAHDVAIGNCLLSDRGGDDARGLDELGGLGGLAFTKSTEVA